MCFHPVIDHDNRDRPFCVQCGRMMDPDRPSDPDREAGHE